MSNPATKKLPALVKWLLPVIIIAIAVGTFMFLMKSKPQAPSRTVKEKVWSVKTVAAEPGSYHPELVLYGKVESPRMTNLTAAVTAFVNQVDTDEGKSAKKGDVLIQLDDRDAALLVDQRRADVDSSLAQISAEKVQHEADLKALKIEKNLLQLSLKTVKRYENLIKRKVSSQEQLDAARRDYHQQSLSITQREKSITDHPNRLKQLESQLQRAHSLFEAAQLDLQRTQIKAPFSGRIASLSVAPGDRVRAGDPLLGFYSLDRLEVRAQIPNRILPQLRRDAQSEIKATGTIDGENLSLSLDRIAAEVDGGRAGVDALFKIKSANYLPEPGRSLSIRVSLPEVKRTLAIPPMALYGLNRVYKISDNRMEAVQVERVGDSLAPSGEALVLIRSDDIDQGDRIITTQLPNAISGLRVKDVTRKEVIADKGTGNE